MNIWWWPLGHLHAPTGPGWDPPSSPPETPCLRHTSQRSTAHKHFTVTFCLMLIYAWDGFLYVVVIWRIQFSSPSLFFGGPGMLRSTRWASCDLHTTTSFSFTAVCMQRTLDCFLFHRHTRQHTLQQTLGSTLCYSLFSVNFTMCTIQLL